MTTSTTTQRDGLVAALLAWADQMDADATTIGYAGGSAVAKQLRALIAATPVLPAQPTLGLLASMAMRYDHGLGMPGYYDQLLGLGIGHRTSHQQRLLAAIAMMRQLYEEVAGHGFYTPKAESTYAAHVERAGLGALSGDGITHEALQLAVEAMALEVVETAREYGCVVTIEHVRTPDAKPGQHRVDVRPTRAHYPKDPVAATPPEQPAKVQRMGADGLPADAKRLYADEPFPGGGQ